jgi:aminoglycoside phosphotransferase (APT) family kinase protein
MAGRSGGGRASIPASADELTPEWLSSVLRAAGVLRRAEVTSCEAEPLGEGIVGDLVRVRLVLDRDEADAPVRLVAKLPSARPSNHALGEASQGYEHECRFYEEVAADAPIPTLRLYHSAWDASPAGPLDAPARQLLDGLPGPAIRILLALLLRVARLPVRRYVLLLEDVPTDRPADPFASADARTAEAALRPLAALHAHFWESPRVARLRWLKPLDETPRVLQVLFRGAWPDFRAGLERRLGLDLGAIGAWLAARGVALLRTLSTSPGTLIHGDYRLGNLLFAAGELRAALDWQAVARGRGIVDVAYFLCADLEPDLAPEVERRLVCGYHQELVARGVTGYAREACLRDYELAKLLVLHRLVVAFDSMELSHEREVTLVDRWCERVAVRTAEVDLEAAARDLAARAATGG